MLICSICGEPIRIDAFGWAEGHNAQPVNNGRCCELCNWTEVIPARLLRMFETDKSKHTEESGDE